MFRPNYFIEWVITPFFKEHILIQHGKFMFFNFPKNVTKTQSMVKSKFSSFNFQDDQVSFLNG